ncbi:MULTISPECIES: hypothetical protein [Paraclostridium]|uniref:Uncharacterized protein n=1 Tax=Paraclostridium benzoelyticum TaxID=1629550 RepID=A0A0M3DE93_9FIRM|nr:MULTISPECIES: hypothetical protein [Paraclostridium]KKY00940.1 hypothetical protein VN21_11380 [Paraclostridium benzoelyticum]MCU9814971.1 hypothetical protein [Paraclostridium sp. AKS73]
MHTVDTKSQLDLALKNRENKITITDKRIVKGLKVLDNVNIKDSDRNRCKYSLRNKSADSAFMGSIGFAPMIAGMANISFLQGMGVISSVGLHETLVIFADYNIKFKNDTIVLNKI